MLKGTFWACPSCKADIDLAYSYQRCADLFAFASVVLLGVATRKPASGGAWLLWTILSGIPLWFAFFLLVPPWLRKGRRQPRLTLMSAYLGAVASLFFVGLVGFGAITKFLGNPADVQEHLEDLSIPLAWISRNFMITRASSLSDVCGVVLGNSFFYALLLFGCYQSIRWLFLRARPTQLNISDNHALDEDDEDD